MLLEPPQMRPIGDVKFIIFNLLMHDNCKAGIKNHRNFEILAANTFARGNLTLALLMYADKIHLSIENNVSNMAGANFLHIKNVVGRLKECFKNFSESTLKECAR